MGVRYSMLPKRPRFSWQSSMIGPMYSVGRDDRRLDHGLLDPLDAPSSRHVGRVVDRDLPAVGAVDLVDDAGRGDDQLQAVFPLQPLLDDLHVQQAQETAAETEAQRGRGLGLEQQRGVVELQFAQGVAQPFVIVAVRGVEPGEDHRLGRPVTGQGLRGRVRGDGDRVAHPGVADVLDAGDEHSPPRRGRALRPGSSPGVK